MRKIFITYGDSKFEKSKERLARQVKALGLFDDIILYGPRDLPPYILSSPLMAYERGGGYWCWKPYIIWNTINKFRDSIVMYADAGCSVQESADWNKWFELMESTHTVVTAYKEDYDYGWENYYGRMSVCISDWTKNECMFFFDKLLNGTEWRSFNKIWGGLIIAKFPNEFVKEWLDITLLHPELLVDPLNIEKQHDNFIQHRHDQCVITPLAFHYRNDSCILTIIPETAESDANAGVRACRICDLRPEKKNLKKILISILGEQVISRFRIFLRKYEK